MIQWSGVSNLETTLQSRKAKASDNTGPPLARSLMISTSANLSAPGANLLKNV